MVNFRTDLASEANELWRESAAETDSLPGVETKNESVGGCSVEHIRIRDERGAEALGKPVGNYISITLPKSDYESAAEDKAAVLLSRKLRELLRLAPKDSVLVAGLGNRAITPDNLGPLSLARTLITRHLVCAMPEKFGELRPVMGLETGVAGTTGVESGEHIRAFVRQFQPKAVIVVDALASRKLRRLCRTIQISDTGIIPGSGVGNAREAITEAELGIPVIAIGIPTVVDAAILTADLMERSGMGEQIPEAFREAGEGMIVTPREIDSCMETLSRMIGLGITLALQDGMKTEEAKAIIFHS